MAEEKEFDLRQQELLLLFICGFSGFGLLFNEQWNMLFAKAERSSA
jgi:hypothetical protein